MCKLDLVKHEELCTPPGVRWIPESHTGAGALVLAGSSGRIDTARAELLARHGVIAESIQWFGGPGQHDGPWEIPIELFLHRVEELAKDCDRVLLLGASFGAEAALLTGAHSAAVSPVVAFAPSDVVWTGFTADGRATSHWTMKGEVLPHLPFVSGWKPASDPPAFVDLHRQSRVRFPEHVQGSAIPVERIPQVVVVAGGDDQVWPSITHAEAIADRRRMHDRATLVVTDPEAGHRILLPGEPLLVRAIPIRHGGNEAADRRLGHRAWQQIMTLI